MLRGIPVDGMSKAARKRLLLMDEVMRNEEYYGEPGCFPEYGEITVNNEETLSALFRCAFDIFAEQDKKVFVKNVKAWANENGRSDEEIKEMRG